MIPLWLLAQASGRGGNRLRKLPPPCKAPVSRYSNITGLHEFNQSHLPANLRIRGMENALTQVRQFWYEGEPAKAFTGGYCRACDDFCENAGARFDHHAHSNCRERVIDACRLLQKDFKCAVCDSSCMRITRGVPMCTNGDCENKYDAGNPAAFLEALSVVRRAQQLIY